MNEWEFVKSGDYIYYGEHYWIVVKSWGGIKILLTTVHEDEIEREDGEDDVVPVFFIADSDDCYHLEDILAYQKLDRPTFPTPKVEDFL